VVNHLSAQKEKELLDSKNETLTLLNKAHGKAEGIVFEELDEKLKGAMLLYGFFREEVNKQGLDRISVGLDALIHSLPNL
jgi:hypothetical protein